MSKVVVQGYILVPENELEVIEKELQLHIELTRQEPGNLVFDITQDANMPTKFYLYEEFVSQPAFAAHQQRAKNATWGKVSQNVERFFEVTESTD